MRYQYRIVNLGSFKAADRMVKSFGLLGQNGWRLVSIYDKGSNWVTGLEKGFALFMKEVPDGHDPDGEWASWEYADFVGQDPETAGFNPW